MNCIRATKEIQHTDTTEMHYFSRWFHCIGIVFEIHIPTNSTFSEKDFSTTITYRYYWGHGKLGRCVIQLSKFLNHTLATHNQA
jgi:hypothetical protein